MCAGPTQFREVDIMAHALFTVVLAANTFRNSGAKRRAPRVLGTSVNLGAVVEKVEGDRREITPIMSWARWNNPFGGTLL